MTSECSTAYNVRKFQQGPARVLVGAALIGQDGLGPRPVVQEDAERPGCTTRTRFFFRRLHRHFLFGAPKRKWGWIDAGHHPQPCPVQGSRGSGTPSRRALRKAQLITQASRRAAKRPRPRGRGMGGNRRKDHPKRGNAPVTAQAALSEAESAERAAGQIQVLPDDLRVQHGAEGSEVSAKPRPCSRRGCIDWAERFRAASRCAGGRSAPVTAQRKAFFLLTAPPPFSFWRAKKKMGVESHRSSSMPPAGRPAHAGP